MVDDGMITRKSECRAPDMYPRDSLHVEPKPPLNISVSEHVRGGEHLRIETVREFYERYPDCFAIQGAFGFPWVGRCRVAARPHASVAAFAPIYELGVGAGRTRTSLTRLAMRANPLACWLLLSWCFQVLLNIIEVVERSGD